MKTCKKCGSKIERSSPHANNVVFCSKTCRSAYTYMNYGKQYALGQAGKYKEGKIQCKICGRWYHKVASHVVQKHGMDNHEYKKYLNRDVKKGLLSSLARDNIKEVSVEIIKNNLLKAGRRTRFHKGHKVTYVRSAETIARLKNNRFMKNKEIKCGKCNKNCDNKKNIFIGKAICEECAKKIVNYLSSSQKQHDQK